ncbi:hypothetical protein A1F94_010255 [Pyrenophora tritici-repentis]|nr:hypothetical protein A1F94_010255 [Pyrenophora tritici-repentis]
MRLSGFTAVALAGVGVGVGVLGVDAAPTAHRIEQRDTTTTASERLGLKWMGGNTTLPKILVLFTGGTIAGGSIYGALDDTQYGQLS